MGIKKSRWGTRWKKTIRFIHNPKHFSHYPKPFGQELKPFDHFWNKPKSSQKWTQVSKSEKSKWLKCEFYGKAKETT